MFGLEPIVADIDILHPGATPEIAFTPIIPMLVPIIYAILPVALYAYGFLTLLTNRMKDIGLHKIVVLKFIGLIVLMGLLDYANINFNVNIYISTLNSIVSTIFLFTFIFIIYSPSEKTVNRYGKRSRELLMVGTSET